MEKTKEIINSMTKEIKEILIKEISSIYEKKIEVIENQNSELLSNLKNSQEVIKSLTNEIITLKDLIRKITNSQEKEQKTLKKVGSEKSFLEKNLQKDSPKLDYINNESTNEFFKTGFNYSNKININTFKNLRENKYKVLPSLITNPNIIYSEKKIPQKSNEIKKYRITSRNIFFIANSSNNIKNELINKTNSKSKSKTKNEKDRKNGNNNKKRILNKNIKYKLNKK